MLSQTPCTLRTKHACTDHKKTTDLLIINLELQENAVPCHKHPKLQELNTHVQSVKTTVLVIINEEASWAIVN